MADIFSTDADSASSSAMAAAPASATSASAPSSSSSSSPSALVSAGEGAVAPASATPLPPLQDWFNGRAPIRKSFLDRTGWGQAVLHPVGEDCAFRRYFRLSDNQNTAILMESVPDGSEIATPGHNIRDYIRIGAWLRAQGLNAPAVYEADEALGYVLLEDFGNTSFKAALAAGQDAAALYGLAVDVLARVRACTVPADLPLPLYYDSHVHTGRRRVVDWFIPALRQQKNPDGLVEEYLAVWAEIEDSLPPCPQSFLHIDYHVENLMWLPDRDGVQACGLLDFQGAMIGPAPYDLANLLEDARQEIPVALRQALLARFVEGLSPEDRAAYEAWYRVLATQFHCRVIGQFIRLAVRDGKPRYLALMPRLAGYLRDGLQAPVLAPLKRWFDAQGVDFSTVPAIDSATDPAVLAPFIREDAF